ncbi:ATP-binding protein [Streptomyces corynorhini]|uniref:ATP-binding protein n=1 Tax=Streptomyces corynorhini TaxID=2282652 RepID=A0A370BB84_9ACTN|nr:ATP-binding protein [Streptomyces corynorhini]RDG39050.1 ATP-binding protein [Streptomyces corynorhini]
MTTVNATAHPVPPPPPRGDTYRLALPNTAAAPKVAREFVSSLLGINRHTLLVEDARLCVTEIVTNAHRHTATPFIRVHVTVDRKRVTVCVADDEPWALPATASVPVPASGADSYGGVGGRGLLLVESLAWAWGAVVHGGCVPRHKVVWFTLAEPSLLEAA